MTQWFKLQCCVWKESGGTVLFICPFQKNLTLKITSRFGVVYCLCGCLWASSTSQNLCAAPTAPVRFVRQFCICPPLCWALLSWSGPGLLRCICTSELNESSFIHQLWGQSGLSIQTRMSTFNYLLEMVLSSSQSMSGSVPSAQQSDNWGPGHGEIPWHGLIFGSRK